MYESTSSDNMSNALLVDGITHFDGVEHQEDDGEEEEENEEVEEDAL